MRDGRYVTKRCGIRAESAQRSRIRKAVSRGAKSSFVSQHMGADKGDLQAERIAVDFCARFGDSPCTKQVIRIIQVEMTDD